MPRLRVRKIEHSGAVPAEFLDVDDPVWASVESALEWCLTAGVPEAALDAISVTVSERLEWGPRSRRGICLGLWLLAHGWVASLRWSDLSECRERLREAGILGVSLHGNTREMFDHEGVRVE